ncbi:hypothetical protein CR513_22600, partial [Mucuna pruriens]
MSAQTEQRQREAEERHRLAEERHMEALRTTEEREEEICRQLTTMKAIMEKPGAAATSPTEGTQVFWAQLFSEEIDGTTIPPNFHEVDPRPHTHLQAFQTQMYISGGNDPLSCKLFPGTLRGVAMHWLATLPPRSIRSFNDLATSIASQFATNKTKAGQFNNSLALRRPLSMEEIRTNIEKHIEVEEDQADRLEKGEHKHPSKPKDYPLTFTPLREKRAQILHDIYHTSLLKYPKEVKGRMMRANRQEWCEFHKAYGHSTEECQTLQE